MSQHPLRALPSCTIMAAVDPAMSKRCAQCSAAGFETCSALEQDTVKDLSVMMRTRRFGAQETVQNEGEPSTAIGIVQHGTAAAVKYTSEGRRQIVGFLEEGDLFGVTRDGFCVASIEAITDLCVRLFPRSAFEAAMERHRELPPEMMKIVVHDLAEANDHMVMLGRMSGRQRLAAFLLRLARRQGRFERGKLVINLVMTRNDIADYLGLSMENVSRGLGQLARDGIIHMPMPHKIVVEQCDRLEGAAA